MRGSEKFPQWYLVDEGGSMVKQMLTMALIGLLSALALPVTVLAVTPTPTVIPVSKGKMQEPDVIPIAAMPVKSTYSLPYPGILPDHPLFFLKQVRDTIVERLISDPLRKTEFFAVQADKSVNTAVFMMGKNKTNLAVAALTQAGEYRLKALNQLKLASDAGKDTQPLIEKMRQAIVKHQETISELQAQAGTEAGKFTELTTAAIEFADQLQKR
jgi:hypothetical protein